MGIFDATINIIRGVNEGRYAAKTTKIVAAKLGIPPYLLPQWVKDSILNSAKLHINFGMSENDSADNIVKNVGELIIKEVTNKK